MALYNRNWDEGYTFDYHVFERMRDNVLLEEIFNNDRVTKQWDGYLKISQLFKHNTGLALKVYCGNLKLTNHNKLSSKQQHNW